MSLKLSPKAKILFNAFQASNAAAFLAAATQPDSIPKLGGLPEIIVTGRANVGKSTFLNALMGRRDLVYSGKKAGVTRALNFFRVGREPGSLILVDSPGYGARGLADWGTLWDSYIDNRKELRAILVLINAPHGVTKYDRAMLEDLNDRLSVRASTSSNPRGTATHVPMLQPVFTKVDRLEGTEEKTRRIIGEAKEIAPIAESPVLSAIKPSLGIDIGITASRQAICKACAEK